ncbi:LysM peptidoglycan-binding domain-containing protein [bacterium]|nr:LysM peptidoglycan-binding domain-containing protein [bacterium]
MMRENPGDSSREVRAMQADGERMPAQVERFARMAEARNARGPGDGASERAPEPGVTADQLKGLARASGAEAPITSPADLKALSANPEALRELMQNPETRKMMQSVLGREGNLDNLTKQLGLDANDPRTAKFFQELGNRLQALKPGDLQSGNMKLQDVLKGLDPQSSKALENYLTHGIGKTGELRLSQVDQLRLNTLRGMLEGQGSMQRPTDLAQLLNTLKTRPLNLDQPTANAFGQNLRELGLQLKGSEMSPAMRLQDIINRSPDANSIRNPLGTTGNDFIARLNGPQEQMIRTLLDNSGKLANLIESGQLNIKAGDITGGTGMRMDIRNPMLSDVMTRLPQSMRGDSFVVRGDITGIIGTQAAVAAMDTGMGAMRAGGFAQAADYMNTAGRSDIPQSNINPYEILSGKPIDPVSGLPYDPYTGKLLDPTTGRVVGSVRPGDLTTKPGEKTEESKRELENKDAELEEAAQRKRRMMMLMLQAQKLREQKEKELREKELKEQKRQQDDKKRTKYIVKYGDTLESIAQKELRNIRFSALIYDINKKIIPVVQEEGKNVVKLRKGLVIWLPSPFEQREFKSKIAAGGGTMPTSSTATAGETNKYATPEEELAAKFGTNWSGSENAEGDADVSGQILADSIKKSEERIKNIESVLGDFDRPRPGKAGASGGKYVVRLGDTLKSVAMKHPLVRDISLWKLLAEVNNLSTATDSKGTPKASLTRGSSIKIPSQKEISEYRDKLGLTRAFDPQAARLNMAEDQPKLRLCDGCGRMSVVDSPCPCSHGQKKTIAPTKIESTAAAESGTLSGDFASSQTSSQNKIGGEAVKTDREEEASVEMPGLDPGSAEANRPLEVLEDLDSMTRLVRHAQTDESPLVYAMQLAGESGWQTLISYEIRESKTYRHDDYSAEKRKSVKIDLPSRAAEELAKNDIVGNWKNYKRKFLRSRP